MLDLLDILAGLDSPAGVHSLMPTMGLACGRDLLTIPREHGRRWTTRYRSDEVTCPDCRAALGLESAA